MRAAVLPVLAALGVLAAAPTTRSRYRHRRPPSPIASPAITTCPRPIPTRRAIASNTAPARSSKAYSKAHRAISRSTAAPAPSAAAPAPSPGRPMPPRATFSPVIRRNQPMAIPSPRCNAPIRCIRIVLAAPIITGRRCASARRAERTLRRYRATARSSIACSSTLQPAARSLGRGALDLVMADAVVARHEDHRRRRDAVHVAGVVAGARDDVAMCDSRRLRGAAHRLDAIASKGVGGELPDLLISQLRPSAPRSRRIAAAQFGVHLGAASHRRDGGNRR